MEFRVKEKMMSQVYNFQKGNNAKRTILQVKNRNIRNFKKVEYWKSWMCKTCKIAEKTWAPESDSQPQDQVQNIGACMSIALQQQ